MLFSHSYGIARPSDRPRVSVSQKHRVELPEEIVSAAARAHVDATQERRRRDNDSLLLTCRRD